MSRNLPPPHHHPCSQPGPNHCLLFTWISIIASNRPSYLHPCPPKSSTQQSEWCFLKVIQVIPHICSEPCSDCSRHSESKQKSFLSPARPSLLMHATLATLDVCCFLNPPLLLSRGLYICCPLRLQLLQVSAWLTRHLLPGFAQVPPSQQSLPWPSCFKWHPHSPSLSVL